VTGLYEQLELIRKSFSFFIPEIVLSSAVVVLLVTGLLKRKGTLLLTLLSFLAFSISLLTLILYWPSEQAPTNIFNGMLRSDTFSAYLRILVDVAAMFTVVMTWRNQKQERLSEYYALVITIVLGAHLLIMGMNLVIIFIALEMISITSYVLTGFSFSKAGAEGSQKYFLFGSVASAVMLYGFTFLYGLTGSFYFASPEFVNALINNSTLFLVAGTMALAGFLYKMAAAPLHPWAPDVYEAAPMPVVAFFSVVPKLAGLGVFTKFSLALNLYGQSHHDWQFIICVVAMLSLTVGNFSALWQKRPKRLMAYSSIAQSGFLLVGVAAFVPSGINFMLFYASVYLLVNFLVFIYLQYFEAMGMESLESFAGQGVKFLWPSIFLLTGFIALTGLPPTVGFTAKIFIFSSVWESYQSSGKSVLLWLLIFGLLNTVVSLFYYLKIPFYAFIKKGKSDRKSNNPAFENFFGLGLVLIILLLFFSPDLLMRWINKINFVL
jgi:NADH-quinone oxidoreductase subunit N